MGSATILALEVVGKVSKQAGLIVYPITNGLVIGSLMMRQKIATRSGESVVEQ